MMANPTPNPHPVYVEEAGARYWLDDGVLMFVPLFVDGRPDWLNTSEVDFFMIGDFDAAVARDIERRLREAGA